MPDAVSNFELLATDFQRDPATILPAAISPRTISIAHRKLTLVRGAAVSRTRLLDSIAAFSRRLLDETQRISGEPRDRRAEKHVLPSIHFNGFAAALPPRLALGELLHLKPLVLDVVPDLSLRCARSECGLERVDRRAAAEVEALATLRAVGGALLVGARTAVSRHDPESVVATLRARGARRLWIDGRLLRLDDESISREIAGRDSVTAVLESFGESILEDPSPLRDALDRAFRLATIGVEILVPAAPSERERSFLLLRPGYCEVCSRTAPPLSRALAERSLFRAELNPTEIVPWLGDHSLARLGGLPLDSLVGLLPGSARPSFARAQACLNSLSLANLPLGRVVEELSSGERFKLAAGYLELASVRDVIILVDRPSRLLGADDLEELYSWCRRMTESGATLLVAEDRAPFATGADEVIDLGDEGEVVVRGSIARAKKKKRAEVVTLDLAATSLMLPRGAMIALVGRTGSGKTRLLAELFAAASSSSKKRARAFDTVISVRGLRRRKSDLAKTVADHLALVGPIAELYSKLPAARRAGLSKADFMLETETSRCSQCEGRGALMSRGRAPELLEICPRCAGARYSARVLDVTYKERSIAAALAEEVRHALSIFSSLSIGTTLDEMKSFGLQAIRLDARLATLDESARERLELVRVAAKNKGRRSLILLDQSLRGMEGAELERALSRLEQLADNGSTIVIVTHSAAVQSICDETLELPAHVWRR